ncbi:metal-dependent hydrolase [candidate division GN15 bacterium]|nr:metal-dependent hydrolase [candidate division GN15 bacterium]
MTGRFNTKANRETYFMDSLSQATLGAAIGEATLGRKVGNKAMLWGALVGTIPDLDVVAYPLMDEIAQLGWHRGISHSILLQVVLAPALGWVIHKIHKRAATWRDWTILSFACLIGAVALDCFTVYGTQVFQPFSNWQLGFNNISIIDPLFTVPLLIGVLAALFIRRTSPARSAVNWMGLGLSTAYMIATLVIKAHVGSVVTDALQRQHIDYSRYMTSPTIFNSVLWRATAETDAGYYIGYHSLFDSQNPISFRFEPRNDSLLAGIRDSRAVQRLLWFSNGWYTVSPSDSGVAAFHDIRFGQFYAGPDDPGTYVFTWDLMHHGGEIMLLQREPGVDDPGQAMSYLWRRILGD